MPKKQEQNGCIISLDQEKEFIKLIKKMYSKAKTSVMINRVAPAPIKVKRGVQQGDPISCLLYNLAIEPLATA